MKPLHFCPSCICSRYFWRVDDDSTICGKVFFPPKYIFKRVRYCTLCILSNGSMRWVIVYEAFYMPLASLELWFACTLYSAGQKNVVKGCVRCGFYHAVFNHVFWRAEYSSAQDNFIKGFLCRLQNCLRKQHIKPFTVPSRVA